jgi:tetratricopeptide (TPR) repeat protein
MSDWYTQGDEIPQLRSYSERKTKSGGLGRTLAWIVLLGSAGMLVLALTAPLILPQIARLIPTRYIVAYAPEPIQEMALQVDPVQENVPTPQVDAAQGQALLQELGPTPTVAPQPEVVPQVAPPVVEGGAPAEPAFVQPTAAAVAPTPTVTPAYVPAAADRAVEDGDAAQLETASHLLTGFTHTYQGWNNCGPATITTSLSYYAEGFTQDQAATFLKPNLEDRNVRPDELVAYARSRGYDATYRVNGDLQQLKTLIRSGYPVVVEKGFDPEPDRLGWMGHYLLLTGYSDVEREFVTMDSYLGPNRGISYTDLDKFWRHFNRTYIVVHRPDQTAAVASIIGEDIDDFTMWTNAMYNAQAEISLDNNDPFAWYNLGSSLVELGRYEQAATAFDESRRLGILNYQWRILWYQFGPYEAYYRVGRYEDVLTLASVTIANNEYAEESFYYKGLVYMAQDQLPAAKREFERALRNNENYTAAELMLEQVNIQLG